MDARDSEKAGGKKAGNRKRGWSASTLFLIALLLVVVGMLGTHYAYDRINREIRYQVAKRLQSHYVGLKVQVGRAILDPGKALVVDNLSISAPTKNGYRRVFSVSRIIGRGNIQITDLLKEGLPIESWEISGLEIALWPTETGWSTQALLPLPKLGGKNVDMRITDGLVRIESANVSSEQLVLHDLQLSLGTAELESAVLDAAQLGGLASDPVDTDPVLKNARGVNESTAKDMVASRPKKLAVRNGKLSSSFFRDLEFEATWDPATGEWELQGSIERLDFGAALRDRLPVEARPYLEQLSGLNCIADASFSLSKDQENSQPVFAVQGNVHEGRLVDKRLPYPLDGLTGRFYVNNGLLQLRELKAHSAQAKFELEADIEGFRGNSPILLHALVTDLELDDRLYTALPSSLQKQWDRFHPQGKVSTDFQLRFDGSKWYPSAKVQCRGASFRFSEFPYPIHNLCGTFVYKDGTISTPEVVTGEGNGQRMMGTLEIATRPGSWSGFIDIGTEGVVPINDELLNALTPEGQPMTACQKLVKSLHPTGGVAIHRARFERGAQPTDTLKRQIDMSLFGCSIRFDGFRYPIYEIQAHMTVDDNRWVLEQANGRNDTARINCNGSWRTEGQEVLDLVLNFDALSVPLEDELQRSLPSEVGYLWTQLQPRGTLDQVGISYKIPRTSQPAELEVSISERHLPEDPLGASVTLQPVALPYLLQDLSCELSYKKGSLQIHSASARHGSSHLLTEGVVLPEGQGWTADLKWLPTTRLIFENDLIAALPNRLREPLRQADFRGPVSVMGWTRVGPFGRSGETPPAQWNVQLDVEDAQLHDGELLDGIRGTVQLQGLSNEQGPIANGLVQLDSMSVKGVAVTDIKGPIAVRDTQLLLGRNASAVMQTQVNPTVPNVIGPDAGMLQEVTAKTLGGSVAISGIGFLDSQRLALDTRFTNVQLDAVIQEVGNSTSSAVGLCNAQIELSGSPMNPQTLKGRGSLSIREASLFELPLMVRVLGFLSIDPASDAAFESADVVFRIDGDRIPIERFSVDGDVVALAGDGWANLRREIHLDLFAYFGNRGRLATMLSPMLDGTRYAPLMQVQVDGSIDAPEFRRKPLPVIEDALQKFFPEQYQDRNERILGTPQTNSPLERTAERVP